MASSVKERLERVQPDDRTAWRAWLERAHATSPGAWLVTFKQSSGKSRLTYEEIIEELLCFGWIDSTLRRLDDERTMLLVTPRRAKSVWSQPNKQRVAELIAQGRMAPAGLAAIDVAKANGSWTALDAVDSLQVPAELAQALAAAPLAQVGFDAYSTSTKKQALWFVLSAKRPETRARRVAVVVEAAGRGASPFAPEARPQGDGS